jgi:Flp pilus assembly protein TadG
MDGRNGLRRDDIMKRELLLVTNEKGVGLVYVTIALSTLLLFTGLATDSGRAYVVKAQLSKAVDGAALAAARMLNSGDPAGEARRVFDANFNAGFLGTTGAPAMTFDLRTDHERGENIVTVTATVDVPTTLMKVGNFQSVTVSALGEARRRMVDLSLVLDVSSSLGGRWPAVRDAARVFVESFDAAHDRMALVTYSNGATVRAQMPMNRGFDKLGTAAAIPQNLPGGSTAMVEGLYRGWDELRTVPNGSQSSLRVLVLFTDGASNSVPGFYDASGKAKGLRTFDFPKNAPDPDGQTWNTPTIQGLYDTDTGASSPSYTTTPPNWNSTNTLAQVAQLPLTSAHTHHRSNGIPTSFPLQSPALTVNGVAQSNIRGLRHQAGNGRYPAQIFNINNAARNLLEIIAHEARQDDDGDYPIRIYTIGMGELVRYNLGTIPEQPEQILMRIANDKRSMDFNAGQREGKYFFAATEGDVSAAFQALQNEIIRMSR